MIKSNKANSNKVYFFNFPKQPLGKNNKHFIKFFLNVLN